MQNIVKYVNIFSGYANCGLRNKLSNVSSVILVILYLYTLSFLLFLQISYVSIYYYSSLDIKDEELLCGYALINSLLLLLLLLKNYGKFHGKLVPISFESWPF